MAKVLRKSLLMSKRNRLEAFLELKLKISQKMGNLRLCCSGLLRLNLEVNLRQDYLELQNLLHLVVCLAINNLLKMMN